MSMTEYYLETFIKFLKSQKIVVINRGSYPGVSSESWGVSRSLLIKTDYRDISIH